MFDDIDKILYVSWIIGAIVSLAILAGIAFVVFKVLGYFGIL
jgi:hypothetical protein